MQAKWIWGGLAVTSIILLARKAFARPLYLPQPETDPVTVFRHEGGEYVSLWSDWLWVARACYGESTTLRGRTAVAWCLLQRFIARKQQGIRDGSFRGLIRGFSQPVNPVWSSLDSCSSDHRGCCGDEIKCSPQTLSHRAYVQSRTWEWFASEEPELLKMVQQFAGGNPPRNEVPGRTNFAACFALPSGSGKNIDGNCFILDDPPLSGDIVFLCHKPQS